MFKQVLLALCVLATVALADEMKANSCMCNIMIHDGPEGKNMLPNVFKNEMKIEKCDDANLEMCKKFCLDTEKEKTNGDLSAESKTKGKNYGTLLCEKIGVDMEKKTLSMTAKAMCTDKTMKESDIGIQYKNVLSCKDKIFVKE